MPRHGSRVTQLALVGVVVGLWLAAAPVAAVEPGGCALSVEPRSGPAGSEFTLSGRGYTPTHVTLQKNGGRQTTVELDLGAADPFEIPIGSRTGDEGTWSATVFVEGTDCRATATFRVTLLSTDVVAELVGRSPGARLPLAAYLLVIGMGFGGGMLLSRRVRLG
jgi:hypothetical protein